MNLRPRGLSRALVRIGQAAENALEVARFGGLDADADPTPYSVVATHPMYRLRRYSVDDGSSHDGHGGDTAQGPEIAADETRPPVLLVPPMMLAADVYDVSPRSSAVGQLLAAGLDPWVIDFGAPEHEEGGMKRTLTDHILALSQALDEMTAELGRPVHLSGYSQGGMFCYQVAAYRRAEGIASLITYGSPVNTHEMVPFGLDDETLVNAINFIADRVLPNFSIPPWMSRMGFRALDPIGTARNQLSFLAQLHDRDALLPREGERRFLMADGWVAWPGPAIAEVFKQFVVSNRMLSGGFVIDDRPVTLADVACPVLCFVGTRDDIAPPEVVRAMAQAAPAATVYETTIDVGHFGLVVGSAADEITWPAVADWIRWAETGGDVPTRFNRLSPDDPAPRRRRSDLERGVSIATNIAFGLGRTASTAARQSARSARGMAVSSVRQLSRMNRLDQVRPTSRVSLAALFAEQAAAAPDDTAFLFEGRGYTYAAADERIDNVVRGLLSLGVRRGAHVGVLMDTRPSKLGVIAALNRLGAITVLLRPDGHLRREVDLGEVARIVADPEHKEMALTIKHIPVHVLGGGGGPRDLGSAVDDMETIDPGSVPLPGWYEANPGRAQDLAFILFTGTGERTRINRITNGRWALSAFGTATAASLTRADTLLSLTPIHHPSALLTGIGAALASRARLAMTPGLDPDTFWDEVRRYGATAVTYTWTMAADLLDAPTNGRDVNHPIRLFIGSGMPTSLWRRVEERFAPARVLEFYASTEGDAVLVNPRADKVGSLGRRLPGSAELKIARFDVATSRLIEGPDGFAQECEPGEVGLLLARLRRRDGPYPDRAWRALFSPGDAWQPTGDLFRVDEDGDHWLIGGLASLIHHPDGVTAPLPVQEAAEAVDSVHLSVAYPYDDPDGTIRVALAVAPREGEDIDVDELTAALAALPESDRPTYLRVVKEIPRTTWHRVRTAPLRREGLLADGPVFIRDADTDAYTPLVG